jgi:glycerol uptake facilitator-like aquaporin
MIYLSAMVHTTIGNIDPNKVAPYVGITNIFVLGLFILAMAPETGVQLNPMITFATKLTGLTGFARAFLYLVGQTAGWALAGGLIRGSYGDNLTQV